MEQGYDKVELIFKAALDQLKQKNEGEEKW